MKIFQGSPVDLSLMADHVNFLRSDHARFWTVNNVDYVTSLPAVVLHDTGANRGGMKECYHGPCDIYDHKNLENNNIDWDFLVQTTQSLIGEC